MQSVLLQYRSLCRHPNQIQPQTVLCLSHVNKSRAWSYLPRWSILILTQTKNLIVLAIVIQLRVIALNKKDLLSVITQRVAYRRKTGRKRKKRKKKTYYVSFTCPSTVRLLQRINQKKLSCNKDAKLKNNQSPEGGKSVSQKSTLRRSCFDQTLTFLHDVKIRELSVQFCLEFCRSSPVFHRAAVRSSDMAPSRG